MKKCKHCIDTEVCDFCFYYNFNPDKFGAYLDKGYCRKHKVAKDPEDGEKCNDFNCGSRMINKIKRFIIKTISV